MEQGGISSNGASRLCVTGFVSCRASCKIGLMEPPRGSQQLGSAWLRMELLSWKRKEQRSAGMSCSLDSKSVPAWYFSESSHFIVTTKAKKLSC